jgi:hypothetical protein
MNASSPSIPPILSHSRQMDRLVVTLHLPLVDFSQRERLSSELVPLVENEHRVLIDLAEVRYVDHFGWEGLLSAVSACAGEVRFVRASRSVESMFVLSHLTRLLDR